MSVLKWNPMIIIWMCLICVVYTNTNSDLRCPWNIPETCTCNRNEFHMIYTLEIMCDHAFQSGVLPNLSMLKGRPISRMNLKYNQIKHIQNDVFNGFHFSSSEWNPVIQLGYNPITIISEYAFRGIITDRLSISFENCSLTEIPIPQLTLIENITSIGLSENDITSIPDKIFVGLRNLRRLSFSNNKLTQQLTRGTFIGLENSLETLYMTNVGLTEFPSKALKSLTKLKYIDLKGNAIHSLPENVFHGFKTQRTDLLIDITNNGMNTVHPNSFQVGDLKMRISQLFLLKNKITNLKFLYNGCNSLISKDTTNLYLGDNPVHCDCEFYDFVKAGYYSFSGTCKTPHTYSGQTFRVIRGRRQSANISKLIGRIVGILHKKFDNDCRSYVSMHWDKSCLLDQTYMNDGTRQQYTFSSGNILLHQGLSYFSIPTLFFNNWFQLR